MQVPNESSQQGGCWYNYVMYVGVNVCCVFERERKKEKETIHTIVH